MVTNQTQGMSELLSPGGKMGTAALCALGGLLTTPFVCDGAYIAYNEAHCREHDADTGTASTGDMFSGTTSTGSSSIPDYLYQFQDLQSGKLQRRPESSFNGFSCLATETTVNLSVNPYTSPSTSAT